MSTANFRTQANFPLYAKDTTDFYFYFCESCGESFLAADLAEGETCPCCGEVLSAPEYDYFLADEFINSVQAQLDELNSTLVFSKLLCGTGIIPGYSGENAEVIVKYFNPYGAGTWLITEAEQQPNGDWLLYGYCHIFEWEWGYVLLSQLQELRPCRWNRSLTLERDLYAKGTVAELSAA